MPRSSTPCHTRALHAVEHGHDDDERQRAEDDADEREERAEGMPLHFFETGADGFGDLHGCFICGSIRVAGCRVSSSALCNLRYRYRNAHSALNASIGFSRDARMAGYIPNTSPVPAAKTMAQMAVPTVIAAGSRVSAAMPSREELADEDAEEAAEDRDQDRLGEELEEDLRRRRADGLARPHFAHALVERRELDVHDHDAADEQRDDPADHERHVVHLVVLLVALQVGDAREDLEVLRAVLAEEDAP